MLLAAPLARAADAALPDRIEFNRDVRPILSDTCFKCHGPDKKHREADRRLDTREGALAENDGVRAIVPGKLSESEAHERMHSTDADEQMPPPKSGKKLTARQMAILDKWIEQGAEYQPHWSYLVPVRSAVPPATDAAFVKNPIDALVLARQRELGLAHAAEADRATLIRIGGGLFLLWKSTKEIHHLLEGGEDDGKSPVAATFGAIILQIILIDIVFSLDSIITAVGMVDEVAIMIAAVVVSVGLMMLFASAIGNFVSGHPTIKMLALAFLLVVGVALIADGLGTHVPKGYIYCAMAFSVSVEMLNIRLRKKRPLSAGTGSR